MCILKISLIPSMHILCISAHTVSGNIARIAAILPELLQYCQKLICMRTPVLPQLCSNIARNCCCNIAAILPETNLHAKSSIAATLQQYCCNIARNCCCNIAVILSQYCGNVLPEGLYFDKGNLSSWFLVMVERLFLAVPQGCLRFVIVVFPDNTHLLF